MTTDLLPAGPTVRLRPKNQLTVPEAALTAVGVVVGARFVVTVDDGAIRLDPVLASYAGALHDIFEADATEVVRREREAWRT